jgi:nitric oxide reductase NorE protein
MVSDFQAAPRGREGDRHVPGEVGIWILVFGDLVIFSLLFIAYLQERAAKVAVFEQARSTMSVTFGAVNTLLLLSGSMFVVLGVDSIRRGANRLGRRMILLTLLCGAIFAVSKYLEYSAKLEAGVTPATNPFYMYYFILTGIHMVHVVFGMGFLAVLYRIARKPVMTVRDVANIEAGGVFWHLVDVLWLALFALLYLMR